MKVSIVGTGYVGLVTGVCLAHLGHEVVCVDVDESKVARINRGEAPIHERGLPELIAALVGDRLTATTELGAAVLASDLTLIAVGTPFADDRIDLSYVERAARQIGEALASKGSYHVVVVKSTVVPGTTEELVLPALATASGLEAGDDFGVGMNPEFLREGEAVEDFLHPDRIVLGGIDERTVDRMAELYSVFDGVDIVRTTPRTAEMIKYAANAVLATMISFSNEIANLSSAVGGVDVAEVMKGVHLDKRLSPILDTPLEAGRRIIPGFTTYLEAGCGFGGSCFPKDVKALIAHGKQAGAGMALLDAVIAVNEAQPMRVVELLGEGLGRLEGRRIAVLGLAFKPNTDDVRESPSIPVVRRLVEIGANVVAFDPVAEAEARCELDGLEVTYAPTLEEAIAGADGVALMTRWSEFERLPELLEGLEPQPLVVDGRRMLARDSVSRYAGIGLG